MLEIKNLTVQAKNDVPILRDVSLSLNTGACVGLTGASGSGKTTLIKSIMGMYGGDLEVPRGEILLDGDNLLVHPLKERRKLCGKVIGFIPQNPMTAFFPHAKVERGVLNPNHQKSRAHRLKMAALRYCQSYLYSLLAYRPQCCNK